MALTDKLTAIADAIRGKTGGTDGMTLDQMAQEIAGMEAGGGADTLGAVLTNTLTEYSNSEVINIPSYAFTENNSLVNVSFPNATGIGYMSFASCPALKSINAPKVRTLSNRCFDGSSSLKSFDFSSYDSTKELNQESFRGTGLETVKIKCLHLSRSAFSGCGSLSFADLTLTKASGTHVYGGVFASCITLNTIVIRNTSVVNLSGVDAFTGTPFASGGSGGTVYVPSALIPEYQAATNWSTLHAAGTCNFVAIEGSEYE